MDSGSSRRALSLAMGFRLSRLSRVERTLGTYSVRTSSCYHHHSSSPSSYFSIDQADQTQRRHAWWYVPNTIHVSYETHIILFSLTGPVLSIRVHSPTEGVVGVKIDHYKHTSPSPDIALFPNDSPISSATVSSTPSTFVPAPNPTWPGDGTGELPSYSIETGGLTARVTTNPYTITFTQPGGKVLTSAGRKHQCIVDVPSKWTQNTASNASCMATDASSNPEGTPTIGAGGTVRCVSTPRPTRIRLFKLSWC